MPDSPTIPTLQDVLDAIARLQPGTRQRDLRSALRTFCRAIGKEPQGVLALPKEIRSLRDAVSPLAIGMSERRWANVCSGLAKAIELVRDLLPSRNTFPIAPQWKALLDHLPTKLSRKLSAGTRWLSAAGITPSSITAGDVQAYRTATIEDRMRTNAEATADAFLWAWQRAERELAAWPQLQVERRDRRDIFSLPMDAFPPSFAAEVEAYLARLSRGVLLELEDDEEDLGPLRPVRPATIATRRRQLRAAASCLVRSGIGAADVTSLAVLVEVKNVRTILQFLIDRNGTGQTSGGVEQMARLLANLAKHWVRTDPAHLEKLKRIARRVTVGTSGMTAKNRDRLRPFDDDDTVATFVCLPDTIRRHVEKSRKPAMQKAVMAQMAAAIALQLVIPLRKSNLAALDLERHFVSNRNGVSLVIAEAETKNREAVDFEVPPFVLEIVRWYVTEHRPHLLNDDSTALFPGRNGKSKSAHTLGVQITNNRPDPVDFLATSRFRSRGTGIWCPTLA